MPTLPLRLKPELETRLTREFVRRKTPMLEFEQDLLCQLPAPCHPDGQASEVIS